MWNNDVNAAFLKALAQFVRVVGLVGNQTFRIASGATTTWTRYLDGGEGGIDQGHFTW